jgi:hypothetical protein
MANHGLAVLETALRVRQLDRTLTTARPVSGATSDVDPASTGLAGLDDVLHGGWPRGQLSDIAGPASSGRLALLFQMLAAATRRGEIAALVDTFDRLDVASLSAAGVDLTRLLWIRGAAEAAPRGVRPEPPRRSRLVHEPWTGRPEPLLDRTIERALKAFNLVLQAGGFGVVALDLADASGPALNRIPFTTWLRVQRTIEGSETVAVVVAGRPLARSAGGITLLLDARPAWEGLADASRRCTGLTVAARIISPRRRVDGGVDVDVRMPRWP